MPEVSIFGTLHVDRPKKVTRELKEFSEDCEILFVEKPREEPISRSKLLLSNPSILVVGTLLNTIWGAIGLLLTWRFEPVDSAAAETVASSRGIPIEPVDMSLYRRAHDVSLPVTVLSWVWFLSTVFFAGIGLLVLSPIPVLFAVAIGLLPVAPFAYLTLSERDQVIAENIADILGAEDGIESGCLVVGRSHISGVRPLLEERGLGVRSVHRSKFLRRAYEPIGRNST